MIRSTPGIFASSRTTAVASALLFDIYTANGVTPYAAFSLRKLNSAYTGACIRIRRASDNAELDIGFTALNVVDTAAIITFASGSVAHIVRVYDQTGNGRNRQSTIAVRQPRIMTAANVIYTTNGRTGIRFIDPNHTLQQSSPFLTDNINYASHMVYRETLFQDNILLMSSSNVYGFVAVEFDTDPAFAFITSTLSKKNNVITTITDRGECYAALTTNVALAHYFNWRTASTGGNVNIGGYGLFGGYVWEGFYLEEIIFQNSTNVSNNTLTAAVYANQQAYYSL